MDFRYIKCHGSGNDFILIDEMEGKLELTQEERINFVQQICDRSNHIGADGVLFVQPSEIADGKMVIINSDGSIALMCGNGLRCVARYLSEKLNLEQFQIETATTVLGTKKELELFPGVPTFSVEIKPISLNTETLPFQTERQIWIEEIIPQLSEEIRFTAISIPNPHLIAMVEEVNQEQLQEIGEKANKLGDLFPEGVNVSLVKRISPGVVYVSTFERGVGLTNACGTAMSASCYVTAMIGIHSFNQKIIVINPGGMVKCDVTEDKVTLLGNATFEYTSMGTYNISSGTLESDLKKCMHTGEIEAYSKLQQKALEYIK